ncbi:YihY/virulence factor BrkB family protein, partial [Ralstonia pseudosolanacearum]
MQFDTRVLRQWNVPKLRALQRYALRRAGEDSLPQVAGSLTFTTVLSLVPILTVAFALFTAFPMFQSFRAAIEGYLFSNLVPGNISRPILTYLNQFSHNA